MGLKVSRLSRRGKGLRRSLRGVFLFVSLRVGFAGEMRPAGAALLTDPSARTFFYGSLEGGVGRGSGEARAVSDIGFSKCRVVVV